MMREALSNCSLLSAALHSQQCRLPSSVLSEPSSEQAIGFARSWDSFLVSTVFEEHPLLNLGDCSFPKRPFVLVKWFLVGRHCRRVVQQLQDSLMLRQFGRPWIGVSQHAGT